MPVWHTPVPQGRAPMTDDAVHTVADAVLPEAASGESAGRCDGMTALRRRVAALSRQPEPGMTGSKARTVLAWLLAHPEESAVRTITELADANRVHPSTLTRLARRLGYDGFPALQHVFRDALAERHRQFYSSQLDRLIQDGDGMAALGAGHAGGTPVLRADGDGSIDLLGRVMRQAQDNLHDFLRQAPPESLQGVVRALAHAPRVRLHGLRQFSALAAFMTYGLGMIRPDVGLLDPHGLGAAEGLAQLGPGDAVLFASVSPYTRSVAQAAQVARESGLTVLALTDGPDSPLSRAAHHGLHVPHGGDFFSNSMGAYMVLCEGLMTLVARALGNGAIQAVRRRETLLARLEIEQS